MGLVQHLTVGERYWFGYHLAGTDSGPDWDFDIDAPANRDTGAVLQDYRNAIEDSDAAIWASGDPNAFAVRPVAGGSSPI